MNRTVLKLSDMRRRAVLGLLAFVIIVAGAAGLTWRMINKGESVKLIEEVIAEPAPLQPADGVVLRPANEVRAADAYSAHLDLLRQQGAAALQRDAVTAHVFAPESLAQAGREAYIVSRLPTTANGYIDYLDNLRRQGQAIQNARAFPTDADEFSEWLDELRGMSQ